MTDDQVERIAQAIHDKYLETVKSLPADTTGSPVADKSWEGLSDSEKEANRAQARDIGVMLDALGFVLVPADDTAAEALRLTANIVETLAEYEHQRWMMHQINTGWTYGPDRDDDLRVHPLIIPYKDLTEAQKELDRDPVRHITTLIALVGLGVKPDSGD